MKSSSPDVFTSSRPTVIQRSCARLGQPLKDSRTPLWIVARRHLADRLVIEQQFAPGLPRCVEIELAAIQTHFVRGTGAIAELCDAPADRYAAVANPLLDVPARAEPGRRQQLLQPGHRLEATILVMRSAQL